MRFKKLGKAMLFPHTAVIILLLPVAAGLLAYSMTSLAENNPLRIASYVLSAYTLTACCARFPQIISRLRAFKSENKYAKAWFDDVHLRMKVTLSGNVLWNGGYAVLQLGLGIYHRSPWFFSLAVYYFSLALMRFFLARHTVRHNPCEKMRIELKHYRTCGFVFLLTNLALSSMIFYMIYENLTVRHHEITTIAMAAYTFTSLTVAIVNAVKYRQYNSPVFSASKAISLAAACVSMLTLENTMLTTFGGTEMSAEEKQLLLSLSGAAISAFIVAMAVYMLVNAKKRLARLNEQADA